MAGSTPEVGRVFVRVHVDHGVTQSGNVLEKGRSHVLGDVVPGLDGDLR